MVLYYKSRVTLEIRRKADKLTLSTLFLILRFCTESGFITFCVYLYEYQIDFCELMRYNVRYIIGFICRKEVQR